MRGPEQDPVWTMTTRAIEDIDEGDMEVEEDGEEKSSHDDDDYIEEDGDDQVLFYFKLDFSK